MIPPIDKCRPMSTAPRDGTCVIVVHHEYNDKSKRLCLASAQWLPNAQGEDWTWRRPFHLGTTQFAAGWLTISELLAFQAQAAKSVAPEFDL